MDKLLPIGSLIQLQQSNQKLMIYGRKITQIESGETWDYLACLYPFGFVSADYNVYFNHSSISQVLHMGFEDEEETEFVQALMEHTNK